MSDAISEAVATVSLRPGHVQPVWAGHPWIYAQAIAKVTDARGKETKPHVGDVVRVVDPHGNEMGRGFWSPRAAIPVRIVSRNPADNLDSADWLAAKITLALARRDAVGLPSSDTDGYRLLHAEGDEIAGLVVDRFGVDASGKGGVAVVQVATLGLRKRGALIVEALRQIVAPDAIIDRTSQTSAKAEGFEIEGSEAPISFGPTPERLRFSELGVRFELPFGLAQKTGFYFDQRGLRRRVGELSRGRRVLDAYCYVGPIAISAARGGASSVTAIDDSLPALEAGAAAATLNGVSVRFERGDVRRELPRRALAGERYDLLVLDPPKIAPTRGDRDAAMHYQTKLIESACAVIEKDGLLVVCSCSQALGHAELARALAVGCKRAGRDAIILERHGQGADHPVPAAFPEGLYLSTLIAQIGGEVRPPSDSVSDDTRSHARRARPGAHS